VVQDKSSPTPEKQLLKLIEEPSGPEASASPRAVRRGPSFSLGSLRSRFAFWSKGFRQAFSGGMAFDIKKVNALLIFAALVSGAFFVSSSAVLAHRLSEPPNFSFTPSGGGSQAKFVQPTRVKKLETYMQMARSRDIFRIGAFPPTQPDVEAPSEVDRAQQEREERILGQFRLVGISWSDDPDAMIENTAEEKTYFIKRGHHVNGVRVEAIYRDRVILNFEGKEVELR